MALWRRPAKGAVAGVPGASPASPQTFDSDMADPDVAAAEEALERTFAERTYDQLREWWSRRLAYPAKWRRNAYMFNSTTYLTAAELEAITVEVHAIYTRYGDRAAKEKRPAGALPVRLYAHGHPLQPTPSGN